MCRFLTLLFSIPLCITFQPVFGQANDTLRLYFDLNIPALNKTAQQKIDGSLYNNKIMAGENVFIIGYADYLGSEQHNVHLSEERANNVAKYLINYGISKQNIKLCIGKGAIERNVKRSADGYPTDRRVDIVVQSKPAISKDSMHKYDISAIKYYKPGQTFVLKNMYFWRERHVVKDESQPELKKLYDVLLQNPTLKIRIEGHVCCVPNYTDAYDIDNNDNHLSVNRAKYIYDYLVKNGIPPGRLTYIGFGRSKPIVPFERDEYDAQLNRRVEIRVIKN